MRTSGKPSFLLIHLKPVPSNLHSPLLLPNHILPLLSTASPLNNLPRASSVLSHRFTSEVILSMSRLITHTELSFATASSPTADCACMAFLNAPWLASSILLVATSVQVLLEYLSTLAVV